MSKQRPRRPRLEFLDGPLAGTWIDDPSVLRLMLDQRTEPRRVEVGPHVYAAAVVDCVAGADIPSKYEGAT